MIIFALSKVLCARGALRDGRAVLAFVATARVGSRFWLPMDGDGYGVLLEFPAQWLFMQIGPWMGHTGYLAALGQAALSAGIVSVALAPGPTSRPVRRRGGR